MVKFKHWQTGIFIFFCFYSLSQTSQAQDTKLSDTEILTNPNYYFLRDDLYKNLKKMQGKYKIVNSQNSELFRPLIVPTYKGVRRIGIMPLADDYIDGTSGPAKKLDPLIRAFVERLWNDTQVYNNLVLLNLMSPHVSNQNIKIDNSNTSFYSFKKPGELYQVGRHYQVRTHIQSLAAALLSPESYAKYFCKAEQACILKDVAKRNIIQWGGHPLDNFTAHQVFYEFIDHQLAKLKLWACQLDPRLYLVGSALLSNYDFNKKGFYVTLVPPGPYYNSYAFIDYKPRKNSRPILLREKDNRFFVPMSEQKAEELVIHYGKKQRLFYVVKGKITGLGGSNFTHTAHADTFFIGVNLSYDIVGDRVELFSDLLLTNKIAQINISNNK